MNCSRWLGQARHEMRSGATIASSGERRLQLDRVTLHFVVKRRSLDAKKLGRFLLVPMTLRERLKNCVSLHVIQGLHAGSLCNPALGLLQCVWQL